VTEHVSLHPAVNVGFVLRTSQGDLSSRSAVPCKRVMLLYVPVRPAISVSSSGVLCDGSFRQ